MKFYRKHRMLFYLCSLMMLFAALLSFNHGDKLGAEFDFAVAFFMAFFWTTTYSKFADGTLAKYFCGFRTRVVMLKEIDKVVPHRMHKKWSYGSVFVITSTSGKLLTIQPERPDEFLVVLRHEAPQAEFNL